MDLLLNSLVLEWIGVYKGVTTLQLNGLVAECQGKKFVKVPNTVVTKFVQGMGQTYLWYWLHFGLETKKEKLEASQIEMFIVKDDYALIIPRGIIGRFLSTR